MRGLGRPGHGVRRVLLTCGALTCVLVVTSPAASDESGSVQQPHAEQVLVAACGLEGYGGSVRPREWSPGCAGGSLLVRGLRWSSYGQSRAVGKGTGLFNNCRPSCADATIRRYPTQLTMTRVRRCQTDEGAYLFFTRATVRVRYPRGNPFGKRPGWRTDGTYRAASC